MNDNIYLGCPVGYVTYSTFTLKYPASAHINVTKKITASRKTFMARHGIGLAYLMG